MEKIYFDETTFIWRKKLNFAKEKKYLVNKAKLIIKKSPHRSKDDAYAYGGKKYDPDFNGDLLVKNPLDEIIQIGINECKKLYNASNKQIYDSINYDCWINVVRSKKPRQIQFKHDKIEGVSKYHTHTELSKQFNGFIPEYTFVYYIQMPDVMDGEDGVLYFKSKDEKEYFIRPEEDDLIIMPADMPHAPNNAPNAKINRIVIAGNVGFELIKKQKTIF